ncbi:protein SABRE-like [Malus domestica]|uniref:protein SABRE-like n=1 Tax=Malus domestica TaxID=3750 RepID=UPI003974CA49
MWTLPVERLLSLNEEMLSKSKSSSQTSSQADNVLGSATDSVASKKPHKKQQMIVALSKYTSLFPEKVSFSLPKLDVRFVHLEYDFSVENNIMGIQLKSTKSQSSEDVGETTRLDVQLDFSEIHLLREAGISVLEILEVDVVSFFYIPVQPTSPVRAEMDVKLGGTQCNVRMNRLKPWLGLHFSKKKRMVLREGSSTLDKPHQPMIPKPSCGNVSLFCLCNLTFSCLNSEVNGKGFFFVQYDFQDVGIMASASLQGYSHVQGLKRELVNSKKSRKASYASLRMALHKAAQLRLMEKEKNKSPSYAMRISWQINKVVWSMIVDGKSFAEAEINDMVRTEHHRIL